MGLDVLRSHVVLMGGCLWPGCLVCVQLGLSVLNLVPAQLRSRQTRASVFDAKMSWANEWSWTDFCLTVISIVLSPCDPWNYCLSFHLFTQVVSAVFRQSSDPSALWTAALPSPVVPDGFVQIRRVPPLGHCWKLQVLPVCPGAARFAATRWHLHLPLPCAVQVTLRKVPLLL